MSAEETVPAAPFSEWIRERTAALGGQRIVADRLGMADKMVYRWRHQLDGQDQPAEHYLRTTVEDVVHRLDGQMWEIYPDLEDGQAGPTHAWCGKCREEVAISSAGSCLWCLSPTGEKPKRGGWKRPDLAGSKYTAEQLRALHLAHVRGRSLNSLAKQTYEAVGYGSAGSAATAISREWRRMGLRARDRIEMTVAASTKHGRAPRKGRDNAAYRRWFKEQNGRYQPQCAGMKTQPPGKGDPCPNPAMKDSDFCQAHDPIRKLVNDANLVRTRARQPKKEMVPMAPFAAYLRRRYEELGSWRAVGDRCGVSVSAVHRYSQGQATSGIPTDVIGRDVVERYLSRDGVRTFEDLYTGAAA